MTRHEWLSDAMAAQREAGQPVAVHVAAVDGVVHLAVIDLVAGNADVMPMEANEALRLSLRLVDAAGDAMGSSAANEALEALVHDELLAEVMDRR